MSDSQQTPLKARIKRYLGIAVILALAIWGISAGTSARNTAEENQSVIQTPDFAAQLVLGGPERFADSFEDAINVDDPSTIDTDSYYWSTVVVKNTGEEPATDAEIRLNHVSSPSQVVVWTDGYGVEATVEATDDGTAHVVQLDSVGSGEEAHLMLGYTVEDMGEVVRATNPAEWYTLYDLQIESATLDAENTLVEERVYFPGFTPEPEEESAS